jgi:hypothetical protein
MLILVDGPKEEGGQRGQFDCVKLCRAQTAILVTLVHIQYGYSRGMRKWMH